MPDRSSIRRWSRPSSPRGRRCRCRRRSLLHRRRHPAPRCYRSSAAIRAERAPRRRLLQRFQVRHKHVEVFGRKTSIRRHAHERPGGGLFRLLRVRADEPLPELRLAQSARRRRRADTSCCLCRPPSGTRRTSAPRRLLPPMPPPLATPATARPAATAAMTTKQIEREGRSLIGSMIRRRRSVAGQAELLDAVADLVAIQAEQRRGAGLVAAGPLERWTTSRARGARDSRLTAADPSRSPPGERRRRARTALTATCRYRRRHGAFDDRPRFSNVAGPRRFR